MLAASRITAGHTHRGAILAEGTLFSQRHVNNSCPRDIRLFLGTPLLKWTNVKVDQTFGLQKPRCVFASEHRSSLGDPVSILNPAATANLHRLIPPALTAIRLSLCHGTHRNLAICDKDIHAFYTSPGDATSRLPPNRSSACYLCWSICSFIFAAMASSTNVRFPPFRPLFIAKSSS